MRYTINQISAKLREFATKHKQINEYSFGDITDLMNDKAYNYVMLFAMPKPSPISDRIIEINLDLLIMDLINDDNSLQVEVWSDTLQIALDLRAWLKSPEFEDLFMFEMGNPEPFTHRFNENVAGWRLPIRFKVIDLKDRCQIPLL